MTICFLINTYVSLMQSVSLMPLQVFFLLLLLHLEFEVQKCAEVSINFNKATLISE